MAEFSTSVRLRDVAVRDPVVSAAVDEPARAMILDVLADGEHTVSDLHDHLHARGYDRTLNTIRHHVNELRDAGLVDVTRLEEHRGGTTKYYRATTVVLSYDIPADDRETIDHIAADVAPGVAELVETIQNDHGDELAAIADSLAPCEHCTTQKYDQYLLLTVLRRAFVAATDD